MFWRGVGESAFIKIIVVRKIKLEHIQHFICITIKGVKSFLVTQKIFIYHDGAIGDVLLSLPAISLIRKDNFLHLAAGQYIGELLLKAYFVDETTRLGSSFYLNLFSDRLDDKLKKFFGQFNKAFVFSTKVPTAVASNISKVIPEIIEIKTIPDENIKYNVSEYRLKQLADKNKIFITENIFTYQYASRFLQIPSANIKQAKEFLHYNRYDSTKPLIAIHPGSGGKQKCWPLDSYFELIDILLSQNAFVQIFSGYTESDMVKERINNFVEKRRNLIHISNNELIMVASFLSLSNIYIGNDSGISHLAAMLCEKVIVIFGPTDHLLWKPPYNNAKVISANFECAPCNISKSIHCFDKKCLNELSVFDVYEEISDYI